MEAGRPLGQQMIHSGGFKCGQLSVANCQLPVASYTVGRLPRQSGNQSCGQVVDENAKLVEPVPGEMELELEPVPTIAAVP